MISMARNQGSTSDSADPFYRRGGQFRNSFADDAVPLDAGLADDDGEDEPPQYRRSNKRVPVRRGALPRRTASLVRNIVVWALLLGLLGAAAYAGYNFLSHSRRFRVASESGIELVGNAPNSRQLVMDKMSETIGRNILQLSLGGLKQELEKIPWVESATVIRLWPNRLRVAVKERTPVALVALGERVELIDAHGVVMEMPQGVSADYSFPVITGMKENEPTSTFEPRMKLYMQLIHELDDGPAGASAQTHYSQDLLEVDLSDPENVQVLVKGGLGNIQLQMGKEDFLARYKVYLNNVQKWEQERGKLESVDLRYGREVILSPAAHIAVPPPHPPAEAAAPAKPSKPEAAKVVLPRHPPAKNPPAKKRK